MDLSEPKPKPCLGCGYCCFTAQCSPSIQRYGTQKRCPDLFWDGSKYRCQLISKVEGMDKELAIGEGCCSPLFNTWRQKVEEKA